MSSFLNRSIGLVISLIIYYKFFSCLENLKNKCLDSCPIGRWLHENESTNFYNQTSIALGSCFCLSELGLVCISNYNLINEMIGPLLHFSQRKLWLNRKS